MRVSFLTLGVSRRGHFVDEGDGLGCREYFVDLVLTQEVCLVKKAQHPQLPLLYPFYLNGQIF